MVEREPKPTTTCRGCGLDFPDRDMVNATDDEGGEWCPKCVPPDPQAVAIVGNLSDGFVVFGPYPTWDDASDSHDGPGVWIATLKPPKHKP
jgi:hypothetical protein